MAPGSSDAHELVEARSGRVSRGEHAGRDDGVVRARLVGQTFAEPRFDQRSVDALPPRFFQHRRREIERVEPRESVLDERDAEQTGSGAHVEDPGVTIQEPAAHGSNRGRRAVVHRACELVVVDRSDPLVLGAKLVEIAGAVEAIQIDPRVVDA